MNKNKGSVLIFTLVITFTIVLIAIGIASVTSIERKNALTSNKSTTSFQVAEGGSEIFLQKIKNQNKDLPLSSILAPGCVNNTYSGSSAGGNFEVTFYSNDDPNTALPCATPLSEVDRIKSVGNYQQTTRAVKVQVPNIEEGWMFGGMYEIGEFVDGCTDCVPHQVATPSGHSGDTYCEHPNPVITSSKTCSCPAGYTSSPIADFLERNLGVGPSRWDRTFLCWKQGSFSDEEWEFAGGFSSGEESTYCNSANRIVECLPRIISFEDACGLNNYCQVPNLTIDTVANPSATNCGRYSTDTRSCASGYTNSTINSVDPRGATCIITSNGICWRSLGTQNPNWKFGGMYSIGTVDSSDTPCTSCNPNSFPSPKFHSGTAQCEYSNPVLAGDAINCACPSGYSDYIFTDVVERGSGNWSQLHYCIMEE